MRKIIMIATCLAFIGGVSACKTTIEEDKVTVEDYDKNSGPHSGGNHCPPGHAKKGWC